MNKVELSNVVGGALQEKFNKSFERVIDNLQDQNTSFKVKRSITIKLTFEQNEERDDVSVSVDVQEKLAPQTGMKTSFAIGKDLKTGIASKAYAVVPSPCSLQPFRTFLEVEQPASQFIFRMRGDRSIECALFEADGGAWKREAMRNVKEYLTDKLAGVPDIIIIS